MENDLYIGSDYFQLDELLDLEHKLIREATRDWVKKEVSPIIEEYCQKSLFPKHLIPGLSQVGGFGSFATPFLLQVIPALSKLSSASLPVTFFDLKSTKTI